MNDSQRLDDLEVRFSFQEELLQTLNEQVAAQHDELALLRATVKMQNEQLQQMAPSQIADIADETPPPHY